MAAPSRMNTLPLLLFAGLAVVSTAAVIAAAIFLGKADGSGETLPAPSSPGMAAPPGGEEILRLRDRLSENPGDVRSWKALGRAHMERGEYREAVEAFSQASLLAPGDPQIAGALRELANIARGQGRHKFIP